jgi:hypothetical protein
MDRLLDFTAVIAASLLLAMNLIYCFKHKWKGKSGIRVLRAVFCAVLIVAYLLDIFGVYTMKNGGGYIQQSAWILLILAGIAEVAVDL